MNQKEQLAAMIKCLKQAKQNLWDGSPADRHKTGLICFAINKVTVSTDSPWEIHGKVKQLINRALEGHGTFEGWLTANNYGEVYATLTQERIQQLRHKWVNQIIRDWTKQLRAM